MNIKRRKTRQVKIGNIKIGGNSPISIQSMVKAKTENVAEVINEIKRLRDAGCQIVRVAVRNDKDLSALKSIKRLIKIPLIADIHFNYRLALGAMDNDVDAVRLNPGNICREEDVRKIIKKAKEKKIPIRIGANSGSLKNYRSRTSCESLSPIDKLMVQSVLEYIKHFERLNFRDIIISLKSSDVLSTISAYKMMARRCDYPFHLGVTATGLKDAGIIKSAVGIGALLSEGIGDTIRVSLTSDSASEVEASKLILQSLGLRNFGLEVISCPTCGRCQIDIEDIVNKLKNKLSAKRYPLSTNRTTKIAVMGCEVNGPGEAKDAYIGIAAGRGSGVLFKKGKIIKRVKEKDFVKEMLKELKA